MQAHCPEETRRACNETSTVQLGRLIDGNVTKRYFNRDTTVTAASALFWHGAVAGPQCGPTPITSSSVIARHTSEDPHLSNPLRKTQGQNNLPGMLQSNCPTGRYGSRWNSYSVTM
eukprot:4215130-Amphidinium_carterae.1